MADTLFNLDETDRLLSTTRAVRRRLDLERPVEREVILDCIHLSQQAPTASNTQKWRWMVVMDKELRAEIGEIYGFHGEVRDRRKTVWPGFENNSSTGCRHAGSSDSKMRKQ